MKSKIDYNELKLKFFLSEEKEVKPFIEKNVGKRNGNIQKQTKGRIKEKHDYKSEILSKALEDNKEEMEENTKTRLKKMDELHNKITLKIEKKLEEENLSVSDLVNLRKIIRTEKGLTTNITKDPEIEAKAEQLKIQILTYKDPKTILNEADFIRD